VAIIMLNLGIIGVSCTASVYAYNARFRQPDRRPFPLDSRKSQVRAILLPAAVSICAVVLAVVIPPTTDAFQIVFPVSLIETGVCFAFAYDRAAASGRGLAQTPRPE
jgi:L-asparagine transporter-like permease